MQAHHLFFSTDVERQTLHRRITPSQEQREQQQLRWNDLRDFLVADLGDKTGLPMSSWLQGSYKFGTQIRPARKGDEFDIDLGIYFGWAGDADAAGVRPQDLKAQVQLSLEQYWAEAQDDVREVISPPKERCSRIRFAGDFHIDVPVYHLDAARDHRDLATETKGWEVSDPKALWVWFRAQFADEDTAQVRRLIRYFKMWAALKLTDRPASVLLTVLVAEAYRPLSAKDVETDDIALRSVAASILARLHADSEVENPVNQRENLNRLTPPQIHAFLMGLRRLIGISDAALAAPTETDTAFLWTEAFEHFFPVPDAEVLTANALVPVPFVPEVQVMARPKDSPASIPGINRIGPIPKECAVTFTLLNAQQLPPGARVRWFVRNAGEEAELTNDLGHVTDAGLEAVESTAYRGTHHMDVVVTSTLGRVLGFRRIPVQVSGMVMPKRNPDRPGYRRFAGRR